VFASGPAGVIRQNLANPHHNSEHSGISRGNSINDIDTVVGTRQRSSFLTQAAEKELMRLRQIKALKAVAGAWKDKDHPELKQVR
jgi:hypothetical protein